MDVDSAAGNAGGDAGLMAMDLAAQDGSRMPVRPRPGEGRNSILLGPSVMDVPVGREFRITASVQTDGEIGMVSLTLNFNPRIVNIKNIIDGGLGRSLGENAPFLQTFDNAAGTCTIGFNSPQAGKGVRTGGPLASIVFEAKAPGESVVAVSQVMVADPMGQALTFQTGQARIRVR